MISLAASMPTPARLRQHRKALVEAVRRITEPR
jgi:hypothetical protein